MIHEQWHGHGSYKRRCGSPDSIDIVAELQQLQCAAARAQSVDSFSHGCESTHVESGLAALDADNHQEQQQGMYCTQGTGTKIP